MLIDFCLPARNEEKILVGNVQRLNNFLESQNYSFDWQIIIIINGSQDNSEALVREMHSHNPQRINFLVLSKGGKGLAIKECWRQSSADILVFMDVDLAVSLDNLPALINPLINNEKDLVFGSRLLPSSHTERPVIREISSRSYNFLSRLILEHHFSDLQCGFKAIRRELFNQVSPWLRDNQWFFDTELIIVSQKLNYRLQEIPVDWQENRYDQRTSRIKAWQDSWPFIKNLISLRLYLRKMVK